MAVILGAQLLVPLGMTPNGQNVGGGGRGLQRLLPGEPMRV